jgi:aspartate/tyrosine/aromatic aminotransferase
MRGCCWARRDPDRTAAPATPGGTGAVRQVLELVRTATPDATVWISRPTWPNHRCADASWAARATYRYYDAAEGALDRAG